MPKGSKVLMADDDKMLLDMYKERLELAGYVVQSFYNGEDVLAHVHDFGPDVIMLDVMMPKMNGYEALASLKSDPTTKNVPVVMLSALMRDFNREKAVEGGAEDYLIKSEAMPSDVITKIEQVLQKYGKGSTPVPGATPKPVDTASNSVPAVAPSQTAQNVMSGSNSNLDQTQTPAVPENTGLANDNTPNNNLDGKVFTTPSSDIQNTDLSDQPQVSKPDETPQKHGETLIFEPSAQSEGKKPEEVPSQPLQEEKDPEVAKVTEVAPPPTVADDKTPVAPSAPVAEEIKTDKGKQSKWVTPFIIVLIVILLIIGGIIIYSNFF